MANITYEGNGSPGLTCYDNDIELGSGETYRIIWATFSELNAPRAEIVHEYPGIDGIEVVDFGARARTFQQTGFVYAETEAGLASGRAALLGFKNASTGTLTAKGDSLTNVDLVSCSFGRHATGTGGAQYQHYSLLWRKGE